MRLVDAIRTVLSPEIAAGGIVVKDYEADFDQLWDLREVFEGTVVLIWGDTPAGDAAPVATGPYLSPIHWAARSARGALARGAAFSVSIVDLRPTEHKKVSLCALLHETCSRGWPSWIRMVFPSDLVVSSRDALLKALRPEADLDSAAEPSFALLIDLVRKHLTDPADRDPHHALANLLGPMMLLGDLPASVPAPAPGAIASERKAHHREALWQLLQLTDLLPEFPLECVRESHGLENGTRVFLLDDQWHQGWGEWVCTLLNVGFEAPLSLEDGPQCISTPGETGIEVFAARRADWLLDRLKNPPTPFGLQLDPRGRAGQEILLLDLRLFAEGDHEEVEFLGNAVEICRSYENHAATFSQDELAQRHPSATSRGLVGRLVALKDLSYPVILFSSTADRTYVQQFAGCPNVITSFAKPGRPGQRFEGTQDDTTTPAFFAALREAKKVCDARAFIHQIGNWAEQGRSAANALASSDTPGHNAPDEATKAPRWTHVELYLDESSEHDKNWFRAGGYMVLYADESAARVGLAFDKTWGFSRDEPFSRTAPPETHRWPKAKLLRDTASIEHFTTQMRERACAVRDKATTAGTGVAACILRKGTAKETSVPGPDATYRALATSAIELFLYDWLPALETAWGLRRGTLRASIFVGTRLVPSKAPKQLIEHQWRFGLPLRTLPTTDADYRKVKPISARTHTSPLEPTVGFTGPYEIAQVLPPSSATHALCGVSMGPADAYAMIVGALHQRANSGLADRLCSAVAVTLADYGRNSPTHLAPPQLPRQVHFATDDLLGASELWPEPPIKTALDAGFEVTYGGALESYLRASRAFDAGDLPRGLTELRTASLSEAPESILRWLAVRSLPRIRAISANDFTHFARGVVVLHQGKGHQKARDNRRASKIGTGKLSLAQESIQREPQGKRSVPPSAKLGHDGTDSANEVTIEDVRSALEDSGNLAALERVALRRVVRFEKDLLLLVEGNPRVLIGPGGSIAKAATTLLPQVASIQVVRWSASPLELVRNAFIRWKASVTERNGRIEVSLADKAHPDVQVMTHLVEACIERSLVVLGP